MLNIENLTTLTIDEKLLEKISKKLAIDAPSREVDLTLCDNQTIQYYNKAYRGNDKATDVLSFPIENDIIQGSEEMPLGSIVISADFVRQKAQEFSHTQNDELALLFIHGMLHLLGFNHETDNGEMRRKEEETIHTFHLPQSLIIRTEES
jgi:probable rRNA maturation factor